MLHVIAFLTVTQNLRKGEYTMSRLKAIEPKSASSKTKELLDAVNAKFGMVPNLARVMANSPVVLEGYLAFSGALGTGTLDPQICEQIALITAQANHCDYCLSAHTALGKLVGLNEQEINASREGRGSTERATAALTFAKQVLDGRGQVSDENVQAVRKAGFSDGEVAEIIAHVAINVFTNYFNIATQVEIDFPKVSSAKAA
jgi:uncharacterized peroxidase-related enzyme